MRDYGIELGGGGKDMIKPRVPKAPNTPKTKSPLSKSPLKGRLSRRYDDKSDSDEDEPSLGVRADREILGSKVWQPRVVSVTVGKGGDYPSLDSLRNERDRNVDHEDTDEEEEYGEVGKLGGDGLEGWWETREELANRRWGDDGEGGWELDNEEVNLCDDNIFDHLHQSKIGSPADLLGWKNVQVEKSYTGPRLGPDNRITQEFCVHLIEHLKDQRRVHQRYAWQIVATSFDIMRNEPTLVDVKVADHREITVCGDVHGQFYDLLHVFELNGLPSKYNPYVFNGDFVDRGPFSVEVVLTLLAFKCVQPESVILIRGNHESSVMNLMYGFHTEMCAKHGAAMASRCQSLFCHLPLAACINETVLVMHGGLFSHDEVTLDDIRNINRFREPPDEGLMAELLWSDPMPGYGRAPNSRGIGVAFGEDVTATFLEKNGLSLLIRSHEVKPEGYEVCHNGQLVTVFSAPNYCDRMGNLGAFIRFRGAEMVPHYHSFECSPHPDVPMYVNPALF